MFNNLSAWFSESVGEEIVEKWVSNGGRKAKRTLDADYCFSASCCVEDTKSLLEPDPKKRRIGFPLTVYHPQFIESCIGEEHLLDNAIEFAIPSEQLLPTVAHQRGAKDSWLLELLKVHRSHLDDDNVGNEAITGLALDVTRHLGLKRKIGVSENTLPQEVQVASVSIEKCNRLVFASPQSDSVSLKEITLSKCQLRLLRLHHLR